MKSVKKMLSLLLICCLLIPSFVSAADFKDVPLGVEYYESVDLLSDLGIIQGYPDGSFAPDNDVTRAEFTSLLIRAMNLENIAKASNLDNFPFTDCTSPGIAYALPNIKLAYERGIILGIGDNLFAPEDNVTYEQAVKMVVCAAGYEVVAIENGGWPYGYLTTGQNLSLLNGVNGTIGVPAKRWQIAQLLYNAFDVNLMEKSLTGEGEPVYTINQRQTWLNSYLNLTKDTGFVVADSVTSISSSGLNANVDECVINQNSTKQEDIFKLGNCSVDGLIGKSVVFYYEIERSSQNKVLKYIAEQTNNVSIKINVEDLIGFPDLDPFNGGKIEYWENSNTSYERKTTLTVAPSPTFVLNGKIYTPTSRADFKEEMESLISGEVEFIDSTSSGAYDKIFITKIETYVVSKNTIDTVSSTARVLTDMYRTPAQNNTYTIDENDGISIVNIVNKNGVSMKASEIGTWSVVEIKESKNDAGRTLINITVVNDKVTGSITEVTSDGRVGISGKIYKLSQYYQQYAMKNKPDSILSLGDTGTFYLNSNGEIAAVDKQDVNVNYGYIYKMGMKDGELSTDEFIIQMRRSNGTLAQYSIKNRISYDGSTKTPSDGYNYLLQTAGMTNYDISGNLGNINSQLVKYTLDASGNLKTIVTVNNPSEKDVTATTLTRADLDYEIDTDGLRKVKYNYETSTSGNFTGAGGKKIQVNANTIVYLVTKGARSESDVRVGSVRNDLEGNKEYIVEVFDVEASLAKVIVVYVDTTLEEIDFANPLSIVTDMRIALNPSETSAVQFDAFRVSSSYEGLKTGIWTDSTSTLDGIRLGDVIKTATDGNGYVRSDGGVELVWSVNSWNDPSNKWINTEPIRDGNYYYQTIVGYLYSISSDQTRIAVVPTTDISMIEDVEPIYMDITNLKGYLIYDGRLEKPVLPRYEEGSKPEDLTFDDVYTVMKPYETNPDSPTEVLIHLTGSTKAGITPKLLYVIQR